MSRRSNQRKRERQAARFQERKKLEPPVSPITGDQEVSLQLPTYSELRRISTAALFKKLSRRPEAAALLEAIEENHRSLKQT
jgi:hypothetical protein